MAQQRIPLEATGTYHVWTHANGDENLFREEENYSYFLERYSYHVHPVVETFAYCLMPNHLHLAVRIKEERSVLEYAKAQKKNTNLQGFQNLGGFSQYISQQFSNLFNGYTKAFNKKYNRKGSLFIPNFRRKRVDAKEYFVQLIAYIHNNPVHHGFVKSPRDWSCSSWRAYLFDKRTKIDREKGLRWFDGKETFKKIHQEIDVEKLTSLFEE